MAGYGPGTVLSTSKSTLFHVILITKIKMIIIPILQLRKLLLIGIKVIYQGRKTRKFYSQDSTQIGNSITYVLILTYNWKRKRGRQVDRTVWREIIPTEVDQVEKRGWENFKDKRMMQLMAKAFGKNRALVPAETANRRRWLVYCLW